MRDLMEILALKLPIGGKTYTIPWLHGDAAAAVDVLLADPSTPLSQLRELALGDVLQEMRSDGLDDWPIDSATFVALIDHRLGRAAAEHAWDTDLIRHLPAAEVESEPPRTAARKPRKRAASAKGR